MHKKDDETYDTFFKGEYYRKNRFLLMAIGLWPFQNRKLTFGILFGGGSLSHTILLASVLKIINCRDNMEELLQCLPMFLFNISAFIRHLNNYTNMDNMKKILMKMQEDWSIIDNEVEREMLEEATSQGRTIALLYGAYLYTSAIIFGIIPSFPTVMAMLKGENYTIGYDFLPTPVYYNGVDEHKYFFAIAAHVYTSAVFNMTILVSIGGIFMIYVQHACGLFRIVGYQLEHCADGYDLDINLYPTLENDASYKKIISAIQRHSSVIEHTQLLESTYATSFLLLLGINALLITFTGFQTVMNLGSLHLMIRYGTFTVGQLIHLFFECLQGQQMLNVSGSIRDCAFRASWYRLSMRSRVLLNFVIMRSEIYSRVTAGRIFTLCFESYSSIVRTSMSYFTVLRSTL